MTRTLDLTEFVQPDGTLGRLAQTFENGFRRRLEFNQGRWSFSEPPGGLHPNPLLTVGASIELERNAFADIAERLNSFLGTEFDNDSPPVPQLRASDGYGLLSDLEQLHLRLFFTRPRAGLPQMIARELLPFMMSKFGATHVCVIRPNHAATQSRLSLVKILWAAQEFSFESLQKVVMDDQILDSIFPSPLQMMYWVESFFSLAPTQLALPLVLPGGYLTFFGPKIWTFPRMAAQGMLGNFTSSVPLSTSQEDTVVQTVGFRATTPERTYAYIRMATELINNLVNFCTNPLNFLAGEKLNGLQQIQFVTALNFFMNDMRSMNSTMDPYQRMSLCLSAVDKLANVMFTVSKSETSEMRIFKSFFRARAVRELRNFAQDAKRRTRDSVYRELLALQPKRLVAVQSSIRDQMRADSSEDERLDWLWSYRNLRHGTFLRNRQFHRLFIKGTGIAPGELAQATMALLIALGSDPKRFLDAFAR